jgi:hypothetical protein
VDLGNAEAGKEEAGLLVSSKTNRKEVGLLVSSKQRTEKLRERIKKR